MCRRASAPSGGSEVNVATEMVTSYPTPPHSTMARFGVFENSRPRRKAIIRKIVFEVRGSRFEVQGSRFKVQGSRFKVQGSRFKVQLPRCRWSFGLGSWVLGLWSWTLILDS